MSLGIQTQHHSVTVLAHTALNHKQKVIRMHKENYS
jgi:hypothetical protein